MEHFDCVIIGGGMVGAASALTLAQLGLKVALVEKFKPKEFTQSESFDLRVSAISIASKQLLEQVGAWQQLTEWRLSPYKRLGVGESDVTYTEFNAKDIEQPALGYIVENRLVQLSLWQQIEAVENIHMFSPDSLIALTQDKDKVTVTLSTATITAKLLIGADGAQSKVRKMSDIGITGWDYQQSAMLINVETSLAQQDITWQSFKPTGPVAFLPLPGESPLGSYASLVWYHKRDEITRLTALSNSQLQQEVINAFPTKLGKIKVLNKGSFPLTRRHANSYQNKRILLLGDAAHTINPMAGQGVNLGFKDVIALQHVIANAISVNECWHDEAILSRYEKVRRKDNLLMMSTMDALYVGYSHPSPLIKAARTFTMFAINKLPILNREIKNKALAYACGVSL